MLSQMMNEWEEQDRFSFEDSERFEEDSLCSWISEPESVVNNWRGWRKQSSFVGRGCNQRSLDKDGNVLSLTELAAREVASSIPFEAVEQISPPVPEPLQLRIAYYSFPDLEEDIRLYSCLAYGSAEEFNRGENLFKNKAVKEPLQIGFHLSATVVGNGGSTNNGKGENSVQSTSVTFDRKKIVAVQCSCKSNAEWCCHLVALCLHRIHMPESVKLRAPVSESLGRLQRDQLQKFAQYLISELPQQILPTAQRLLDDLLSGAQTEINSVSGAPDPTAGGNIGELSNWCLDSKNLRDNIKKILIKFCIPAPIVFSDVNYLSTTAPPSAAEWSSFLRPLRGREPEGMWNLLSIVREMYKRNDRNSIPLLEIVTLQCLETVQIMIWWFNTKVAFHQTGQGKQNVNSTSQASQNACSSMCDEIVTLWKLAALNPCISPAEREMLKQRLIQYHTTVIEKVQSNQSNSGSNSSKGPVKGGKETDIEIFAGFKPAIQACYLDWNDYPISGVTYGSNPKYVCPFTVFQTSGSETIGDANARAGCSQVSSSQAVLRCEYPGAVPSHHHHHHIHSHQQHHRTSRNNNHPEAQLSASPAAAGHKPLDRPSVDNKLFHFVSDGVADAGASHNKAMLNNRSSSSSEDVPSDEGLEEGGPSHSEGEGVSDGNNNNDEYQSSSYGAASSGFLERNQEVDVTVRQSCDKKGGSKREMLRQEPESSPEQDLEESDWSSGGVSEALPHAAAPVQGDIDNRLQHESQDYQVYFYDSKMPTPLHNKDGDNEEFDILKNIRQIEDPWEILFMRAEGIHAHGYQSHACDMAVSLALDMLKNPPDFSVDPSAYSFKGRKKRGVCAASHQITNTASTTLAHCAFLCTVLSETAQNASHLNLAFQIGMFGLEMARPPASTKPMEVKLAHQESDLVSLLKRLPLGPSEMAIVRERALQLKEGTLKSRGEALLPLMLASFIFESLVLARSNNNHLNSVRLSTDEQLGFEAAVAAIGLKANVCEADHPLLCEGTRRQRGDLALMLLVNYKDEPEKLAKIMEKLLDKDIHQMFKSPILPSYYSSRTSGTSNSANGASASVSRGNPLAQFYAGTSDHRVGRPAMIDEEGISASRRNQQAQFRERNSDHRCGVPVLNEDEVEDIPPPVLRGNDQIRFQEEISALFNGRRVIVDDPSLVLNLSSLNINMSDLEACSRYRARRSSREALLQQQNPEHVGQSSNREVRGAEGGAEPSGGSSSPHRWEELKTWESKFRCANLCKNKPRTPGHHMASIDSSAPETASSDNSPTLVRRFRPPPSDSGSSGNSSDSSASRSEERPRLESPPSVNNSAVSSMDRNVVDRLSGPQREAPGGMSQPLLSLPNIESDPTFGSNFANHSMPMGPCVSMMEMTNLTRTTLPNIKVTRFKGKRGYPSVPNQPSEASAHFMFELAKTVLTKAGGTSTTSLFTQPTGNQNPRGPQRALHMCAFQIGLYALGLHNRVSPNWISRTYSSHVSWITGQAMEIGSSAISFLIGTWEGHLTPPEAASIADRSSKGRDPGMVTAAAELALSCLSHAHALNQNEIARAIMQCKEQSDEMLEKACLAVEDASRGGGVCPEVMFAIARQWFELYEKHAPSTHSQGRMDVFDPALINNSLRVTVGDAYHHPPALMRTSVSGADNVPLMGNSPQPGLVSHPPPQGTLHLPNNQFQVGMQFPIYSLIQGFPHGLPPQIPLQMQMYVGPPHSIMSHGLPNVATSLAGGGNPPGVAGAGGFQFAHAAAGLHAAGAAAAAAASTPGGLHQVFHPPPPDVSGIVPPRLNMTAGGPMFQLTLPNVSLPLLPTPPQPPASTVGGAVTPHLHGPPPNGASGVSMSAPPPPLLPHPAPSQSPLQAGCQGPSLPLNSGHHHPHHSSNMAYHRYLISAFRVGMLALETLGRRISEDRPQNKFTRNPSYADDVKWMLKVGKPLGLPYLQNFLVCVMATVVSPFILHDLTWEFACYFAAAQPTTNPASQHFVNSVVQQIRTNPHISSLAQKCYQTYYQCIHQKLYHLTPAEYEDFVSIIIHARKAFMWTPTGQNEFQSLLNSLKRNKGVKKELWSKITAAINANAS